MTFYKPRFFFRVLALGCLFFTPPLSPVLAQEEIVEIVVTGHQPGPPLWRVSKGDHVLWILPLVSHVPKEMIWDDDRVAGIIAGADEAIGPPDISVGVSKSVLLNPINIVRGISLYNRIRRIPDKKTLADVLPEDVHRRYAQLKAKYFPKNKKVDRMRPSFAAEIMESEVLQKEQLVSSEVITRKVEKLIKRDRDIRYTEVKLERDLEGNFRELSDRVEDMTDSMSLETETGCFELKLTRVERHLNDMKEAANAWATGYARDMEDFARTQTASIDDPCSSLLLGSSEGDLVRSLLDESLQRWLDAAVSALENNGSTFTMLPMEYLIGDLSLVDKLTAMGYQAHIPK